jgi:hypothetical protein
MFAIGYRPGEVYTETNFLQGKCPALGTTFMDGNGKAYTLVKVGAAALTNGLAVVINANTWTTVLGTAAAAGVPNLGQVGLAICSITASTSQIIWMQVFGRCDFATFAASASALPGAAVKFAADGSLTAVGVTTASAYIAGMTCFATNSVISSPVGSVFLNYPKAIGG